MVFPPILSSLCHHLQSIGKVIIFPFLKVVFETIYLKLGLKPTCQGLCAVLSLSHIRLGLEPGQNPWCLVLGPNEAQALDVSLQKKPNKQKKTNQKTNTKTKLSERQR